MANLRPLKENAAALIGAAVVVGTWLATDTGAKWGISYVLFPHFAYLIAVSLALGEAWSLRLQRNTLDFILISRRGLLRQVAPTVFVGVLLLGLSSGVVIAFKFLGTDLYLSSERHLLTLVSIHFYWLFLLLALAVHICLWPLPRLYRIPAFLAVSLLLAMGMSQVLLSAIWWDSSGSILTQIGQSKLMPFALPGLFPDPYASGVALAPLEAKLTTYAAGLLLALLLGLWGSMAGMSRLRDLRIIPVPCHERRGALLALVALLTATGVTWVNMIRSYRNLDYAADAPVNSMYPQRSFPTPGAGAKRRGKESQELELKWTMTNVRISVQPGGPTSELTQEIAFRREPDVPRIRLMIPHRISEFAVALDGKALSTEEYRVEGRQLAIRGERIPLEGTLALRYRIPSQSYRSHQGNTIETEEIIQCAEGVHRFKISGDLMFQRILGSAGSAPPIPVTGQLQFKPKNNGEFFPVEFRLPEECSRYDFFPLAASLRDHETVVSGIGDSVGDLAGFDPSTVFVRLPTITVLGAEDYTPSAAQEIKVAARRLDAALRNAGFSQNVLIEPTCFSTAHFPMPAMGEPRRPPHRGLLTFMLMGRCFEATVHRISGRGAVANFLSGLLAYKEYVEPGDVQMPEFLDVVRRFYALPKASMARDTTFYDAIAAYSQGDDAIGREITLTLENASLALEWLQGKTFLLPQLTPVVGK